MSVSVIPARPATHGHSERLREYLLAHAAPAQLDMETVARKFGMSVRSFRRRLSEEGVTYGVLVDEALVILAKRLLDDPHKSIQDAAYGIGFSEASAFHRAFKRWTGMTPKQYRDSR
jgi:AraC-like DNA-binding protein